MTPYSPYLYPGVGLSTPLDVENATSAAVSSALVSVVEGNQQATNGLLSYMAQERAANDRMRRQNASQLTSYTAWVQSLALAVPTLASHKANLDTWVHQTFDRPYDHISGSRDGSDATASRNLRERETLDTLIRELDTTVQNIRRISESLTATMNMKSQNASPPPPPPSAWPSNPCMSDPSFGTTYPYAPHVFPMTIPPSSRSASFPASSRGHLPHLPQQTPRSVHWGPYGPGPGDDNFSVPSTESERLTPPGFTGYKFPPVPSWNPMYTGTSSQTVRPPTNHHLTPVFTQSPMRSPSPETEVTQYAPGGLFGPRSPSQSMEDGQSRRSSRTETHESMSENDFVRGFTCIPAPPLQPLPPQVPRPRDFVPSVPSEASRRSPSPPPLVNSPPRLRVTPVWDPEIHNSPLIRPPSAALMESLRVRTPPIELVLPSLATPPRPITIETTAPLAHTAKRRFEPRHASSLSTSSTIDEPSTMSSPARSIFTDSSYIAPSAPQHVEEDASFFTPLPARRSQTILMLESFFDTLKRDFQFPNKVELSYRSYGFILDWARVHPSSVISSPADGAEHRKFSLTDASVHAYMQDLRKLLGDLESLRPDNAAGREELSVRIEEELERTEKWIDTVCVTAGSLNLADQAISAKDVFSGNGRL